MKMVTKTAFANMKYHRSKNILTGVAIFLTTVLLFMVPTVGMDAIDLQFAMVNKTYPTWHALYRNVDTDTAEALAAHRDISAYGLRSDVGRIACDNADIAVYYLDKKGMELYRMELQEGKLPEKENEIVISEGILKEMGISAGIGDTVTLPFQRYLEGGLDYSADKEFKISGLLPDSETGLKNHSYAAVVSRIFLENEIPQEQIRYRFLFQTAGNERINVQHVEESINNIAAAFGIPETDININTDYLSANYVDEASVPTVAMIMIVIVLAAMITIYSIYYVSMTQRVQEFGRLKAIGATRRQIRQIVLREGLCVAAIAMPLGVIVSTVLVKPVLQSFIAYAGDGFAVQIYREIIENHEITFLKWWIYLLTIVVMLLTVYFSLLVPMRKAAKISEVEAMRYQGSQIKGKTHKGYCDLTVGRLAKTNLAGNKKKSLVTILSMSITGVFVMVVATVLTCMDPTESANNDAYGQYKLELSTESGNREHPEREWENVIRNNPLSEGLKEQLESLDGVEKVEAFTQLQAVVDLESEEEPAKETIIGYPKACFQELKEGIVEGDVTWEELLAGNKMILNKAMLRWYPDLQLEVGDVIRVQISDGNQTVTRELEIAAIGDYRFGLTEYNSLIMAKEAADQILDWNCTGYFHVLADKDYDAELEADIQALMEDMDLVEMETWKMKYDQWAEGMGMIRGACYAFLSILGIICILNLINTMIHSVYIRKKELGMMQAIGMADAQLSKMLRLEGMFYTLGTLLISIGVGSAFGYPVFLWLKSRHFFSVIEYHYPAAAAIVVTVVLAAVQLILTAVLSHSVKKESLIDRIRFSE